MAGTLTDRLNNAFAGGVAIKSPCRVASTANLTLSGYQTVDGIAIGASDATADLNMRVLVRNQTNSSANGIYVMGTGAWSRARDFDGSRDVLNGTLVWVSTGASQGGGFYNVTNADPVTPDTSTAITFTAADVIAATAAASSAAAFAACAYVAAGSAYVAANSAYVAAGSAYVAANSAYAAAGSAYVAAGSAITNATSAATAAGSAIVAAASAYVAAGSAITNATSAATAAGSAIVAAASAYVAANSAYVAAGCAYAAAACAYVAAGCAASGGSVGAGSSGYLAFYSSATTPVVQGTSQIVYNSAGGLTLGSSGVTAGSLALASTGGGNTTLRGSTAAIAHTLVFPSSLGSSGQFVRLLASGLTDFATALSSATTGQLAFYSSAMIVRGASEITYDSAGGLALGSSGVTAGSLVLSSTGGGNTTLKASSAAIAHTLTFPSSMGSSGQVVQLNTSGGLLGFVTVSAGFTLATEQATTSGTAKDFTGIPTGTKVIIIDLIEVSWNANAQPMLQIGDGGGIETATYASDTITFTSILTLARTQDTASFIMSDAARFAAGDTMTGQIVLSLEDSSDFTWTCQFFWFMGGTASDGIGGGKKSLSAELTQLRFTTVAGVTFDAGAINIKYIG